MAHSKTSGSFCNYLIHFADERDKSKLLNQVVEVYVFTNKDKYDDTKFTVTMRNRNKPLFEPKYTNLQVDGYVKLVDRSRNLILDIDHQQSDGRLDSFKVRTGMLRPKGTPAGIEFRVRKLKDTVSEEFLYVSDMLKMHSQPSVSYAGFEEVKGDKTVKKVVKTAPTQPQQPVLQQAPTTPSKNALKRAAKKQKAKSNVTSSQVAQPTASTSFTPAASLPKALITQLDCDASDVTELVAFVSASPEIKKQGVTKVVYHNTMSQVFKGQREEDVIVKLKQPLKIELSDESKNYAPLPPTESEKVRVIAYSEGSEVMFRLCSV
jgi:hypothetical protein